MVQSFPRGLAITAVAAKDLAKKKRFGAQDPYLAFYVQGWRKFTRVAVKGGVKPEWNQTIIFNQVYDAVSKDDTTLTVSCYHEKTGVKVGSGDGLIGTCQIDLKQSLLVSDSGLVDDWFDLKNDGKDSGRVHLRLQLCEPIVRLSRPSMVSHKRYTGKTPWLGPNG
ncbi:MAG: C2 domain-containing protein [Podila humilis]|nr:MAG: C2 domain-containing protein [Podila humilis]